MIRTAVCVLLATCVAVGAGFAGDDKADKKKTKNNQMVRGTIKSVDLKANVLVVSQKLKNENVDRQLDIKEGTEFEIIIAGEKKELTGKEGLAMLDGKTGAQVQVKCDKDVNVLKVTVKITK